MKQRPKIYYTESQKARMWERSQNRRNFPYSKRFEPHGIDDLSHLRILEHRIERVRLGPAVYRRVDPVRNGSRRVDGSFGHVRIDAQV